MRKKRKKILPYWIVQVKRLVYSPKVKEWCGLPYPGHPKGCPNYNKDKPQCPYNSPYITELLDLNKPIHFVYSEFNLKKHMKIMKRKHPHWTDRQLRNVLYWQNRSMKQRMERAKEACKLLGCNMIITMGESVGVNLYATCRLSGFKLKKIRDIEVCHHIALLGYKNRT